MAGGHLKIGKLSGLLISSAIARIRTNFFSMLHKIRMPYLVVHCTTDTYIIHKTARFIYILALLSFVSHSHSWALVAQVQCHWFLCGSLFFFVGPFPEGEAFPMAHMERSEKALLLSTLWRSNEGVVPCVFKWSQGKRSSQHTAANEMGEMNQPRLKGSNNL